MRTCFLSFNSGNESAIRLSFAGIGVFRLATQQIINNVGKHDFSSRVLQDLGRLSTVKNIFYRLSGIE
jgi:hypothetical protein